MGRGNVEVRDRGRVNVEWQNGELTHAVITVEASGSRWWRRRYVVAEVESKPDQFHDYSQWRFVIGGDRVCDHDDRLAQMIQITWQNESLNRERATKRAKLKSPWTATVDMPPAKVIKR